jgi:hypothetical protein
MAVTMNGAEALREVPSTHSTYAVTDSRRARPDTFVSVSREILTGSATATSCSSSCAIPCETCSKAVKPCPWRTT